MSNNASKVHEPYHINIDIKASQCSNDLLVALHDNPNLGTDTFVDQLRRQEMRWIIL